MQRSPVPFPFLFLRPSSVLSSSFFLLASSLPPLCSSHAPLGLFFCCYFLNCALAWNHAAGSCRLSLRNGSEICTLRLQGRSSMGLASSCSLEIWVQDPYDQFWRSKGQPGASFFPSFLSFPYSAFPSSQLNLFEFPFVVGRDPSSSSLRGVSVFIWIRPSYYHHGYVSWRISGMCNKRIT